MDLKGISIEEHIFRLVILFGLLTFAVFMTLVKPVAAG